MFSRLEPIGCQACLVSVLKVAAAFPAPGHGDALLAPEPSKPDGASSALPFGERPEGLETPAAEPLKARTTPSHRQELVPSPESNAKCGDCGGKNRVRRGKCRRFRGDSQTLFCEPATLLPLSTAPGNKKAVARAAGTRDFPPALAAPGDPLHAAVAAKGRNGGESARKRRRLGCGLISAP